MKIKVADTNGHSQFPYFQCIPVSFCNNSNFQQVEHEPRTTKTQLTLLFSPGTPNDRKREESILSTLSLQKCNGLLIK
jgi:hypothetical protein